MKAIETRYKGHRFRSRLEARWAVFFDALRLEWVYEPEGFDFGNGVRYLPDFRLPDWHDVYIEIKPTLPSAEELIKLFALAQAVNDGERLFNKSQIMLCGAPGMPYIRIKDNTLSVGGGYVALSVSGKTFPGGLPLVTIDCFAMTNGGTNLDIWPLYFRHITGAAIPPVNVLQNDNNLYGLTLFHGAMPRQYIGAGVQYDAPILRRAYDAARSARFEHGETPR